MKILITGNMGYVGPVLVAHLRNAYPHSTLIGLDAGFFGHCLTAASAFPERLLNLQYIADVRNPPSELFKDVDALVHLAAISNDPMGKAYEHVTADINHKASVGLAENARDAGVGSYVFASSCSVYGYAEGSARDENSELNPLTAYAKSKINTERDIQKLADDNLVVTCLRFPTACGMSNRLRLDLVLNDFVAGAVASRRISILSDGTPWRPLIDVKDMARAIDWALTRPAENGGAFLSINVGRNEWNYQVKDLAEAVREQIRDVEIHINPDAQPDKRSYQVDFSKYRELAPDYLPRVDLAQSIAELKTGLEQMNFDDENFRQSDFMRLSVLTGLRERGLLSDSLEWKAAYRDNS